MRARHLELYVLVQFSVEKSMRACFWRSHLFGVVQADPARAALELAPPGRALPIGLFHDGIDAGLDIAGAGEVGACSLADIQVGGSDANPVGLEGCRGMGRIGNDGGRTAEALGNLFGNRAMPTEKILAGASLSGVPPMDGQQHFIGGRLIGECLILGSQPQELMLAVASANVGHQVQQRRVGLGGYGVGVGRIAGDLDGDGPVVVGRAGGAPGAVLLLDTEADSAVQSNHVIAGSFLARGLENLAPALGGHLADEAVNGDNVDRLVSGAVLIGRDHLDRRQRAVCESHCASTSFRKFVIKGLSHCGALILHALTLICGPLEVQQHAVGGLTNRCGGLENGQHTGEAPGQLRNKETELSLQVADRAPHCFDEVEKRLLASRIGPLGETVPGTIGRKAGISVSPFVSPATPPWTGWRRSRLPSTS